MRICIFFGTIVMCAELQVTITVPVCVCEYDLRNKND